MRRLVFFDSHANAVPANLSPEYKSAEAAFRKAREPHERLECLRAMLRTIPKHKGTERLPATSVAHQDRVTSSTLPAEAVGVAGPPWPSTLRVPRRSRRSAECRQIACTRAQKCPFARLRKAWRGSLAPAAFTISISIASVALLRHGDRPAPLLLSRFVALRRVGTGQGRHRRDVNYRPRPATDRRLYRITLCNRPQPPRRRMSDPEDCIAIAIRRAARTSPRRAATSCNPNRITSWRSNTQTGKDGSWRFTQRAPGRDKHPRVQKIILHAKNQKHQRHKNYSHAYARVWLFLRSCTNNSTKPADQLVRETN